MSVPINARTRMKIKWSYRYGDLTCDDLLYLLENRVSPGAMRARNRLLFLLVNSRRHENLAAHNEGSDDKTMHYTIYIDNKGYHLRLDRQGMVYQITNNNKQDLGTIPPWVPPGAVYIKP